jgi:hypothetical protein
MAIRLTPQGGNADLAGRTVTTLDGFTVTYDNAGFVRQSISPQGGTKYFDSLGNQISQPADIQAAQAAVSNATPQPSAPIASNARDTVDAVDADTPPSIQALEDGSVVETFEDGSTLTTNEDGSTSETDPFTETDTGLNVLAEDQFTETDGGLNVLTSDLEESPINEYEPDSPEELGTDEIDVGAQTGSDASDDTTSSDADAQPGGFYGRDPGVPRGAQRANPPPSRAQWSEAKDLRVKLRVPNEYLKGPSAGPASILQKNGGILFPYTPQIAVENQASYASQTPLHSNHPLYFYKSSAVTPITVTAKFTVQNEFEGAVLLGVIHLLRALTKMKFGNDPDAGSPPPVCRFDAYGDYMMSNVPVSIASWRHDLPDNVDYITVGRPESPKTYGRTMVPVLSTISLTMNIMYSRREMLAYNVTDWLSGSLKNSGYL